MVSPSAFAVFRFITSSNLVGCSIGMSAGFAPRTNLTSCRADMFRWIWSEIRAIGNEPTLFSHSGKLINCGKAKRYRCAAVSRSSVIACVAR